MVAGAHPDRVIFPAVSLTRGDLVAYYRRVAPILIPAYRGRALTLIRYPQGIAAKGFYQKHPPVAPAGPITVQDVDDVTRWVALGAVEFHVPLGMAGHPRQHDWAVVDLDPNLPAGWELVQQVARVTASLLELLGLPFQMKTSGRDGLHFYIPIQPLAHDQATMAMQQIARVLQQGYPEWITTERRVARRGSRVYVDYLQNGHTRTMAGVFSVRATAQATVSTPVSLDELDRPPGQWTVTQVLADWEERSRRWPLTPDAIDLPAQLRKAGLS